MSSEESNEPKLDRNENQRSNKSSSSSFHSFFVANSLFFRCFKSPKFSILFFFWTIIMVIREVFYNRISLISSEFTSALMHENLPKFIECIWKSSLILLGFSFLAAADKTLCGLLMREIRIYLTDIFHSLYITRPKLFQVNNESDPCFVDNIDQRIGVDIDQYALTLFGVLSTSMLTPFVCIYYSIKTWNDFGMRGLAIVYGHFVLGSIVCRMIMIALVKIAVARDKKEGAFRYLHTMLRKNAESIALANSEERERRVVDENALSLWYNIKLATYWTGYLHLFQTFFVYFAAILSYLLLGIAAFEGAFDNIPIKDRPSLFSEKSFYTMYLIHSLTKLLELTARLSKLEGHILRLKDMLTKLQMNDSNDDDHKDVEHDDDKVKKLNIDEKDIADVIKFTSVSIRSPAGAMLLRDLSFMLTPSRPSNLIVMGPSGSGKTSILRSLSGIWPISKGSITRPMIHKHKLIIIPATPLFVSGSLADQLTYPTSFHDSNVDEAMLMSVLDSLNLRHLVTRFECLNKEYFQDHWTDNMSPGEQQRLCLGRVLLYKPTFAVLDEASNYLDVDIEAQIYTQIKANGTTLLTISHRSHLAQYHDQMLLLNGFGQWTLKSINKVSIIEDIDEVK